jgi:flagellar biosynthetic protein FlhB
MATYADDRTEPATPRRRQEARAKGQVARSHDLTTAVQLLAAFTGLYLIGPSFCQALMGMIAASLSMDSPPHDLGTVRFLAVESGAALARMLLPLLACLLLIALAALLAQVGPLLTLQPLAPSFAKVSPLKGILRLFSARSAMTAATSLLKLIFVGGVGYFTLQGSAPLVLGASGLAFEDIVVLCATLTFELGMKLAAALLVLALVDVLWQRHRHERDLRMTKEEVKDELRSMEGDPHIKRRRRQLQLQLAMQRLRKDVPTADVVVTNPTHYAVAIKYDSETMAAPKVVAKGADYVAIRIRQIAAERGIPMVERKPLARALYETVEVGHPIPEKFYRAVAEILAYIYELTGRSPAPAARAMAG